MAAAGAGAGAGSFGRILSLAVLRYNGDTPEAVTLDAAYNLAHYSFFERGSIKEFLAFAARTVMKRIGPGVNAVDYEGNLVFCSVQSDGLGAICIADKAYPARVAVTLLKDALAAFKAAVAAAAWRAAVADGACKLPRLEEMLREYQDPTKVDKVMKINAQLAETKEVLHRTIDKVLERGEKLDDLVEKSSALSAQSKMFYKQAKKTNACCVIA
jgi:synaptobrevin homolog YKT6